MSIKSNADQEDLDGKLDPEVEAQRSLLASAATDPKELLSEEADPLLVQPPPENKPPVPKQKR